jgi:hypothetical protein
MSSSKAFIVALSVSALVLFPRSSVAQYNTAELSGLVKDAQGGTLPGATVVATHVSVANSQLRNANVAERARVWVSRSASVCPSGYARDQQTVVFS